MSIWGGAHGEPVTGVWGQSPQRGPRAEPLVRGQGSKPPEAETLFFAFTQPEELANLS